MIILTLIICINYMFVSCVHPLAVLNAAFCITYSLLMLADDARGILQSRTHDCLIDNHECLLLFTPNCCGECFFICSGLFDCTEML